MRSTLARCRVDDRVIGCKGLIAPIRAPRIAGCTERRRGPAATYATHQNARDANVMSKAEAFTVCTKHCTDQHARSGGMHGAAAGTYYPPEIHEFCCVNKHPESMLTSYIHSNAHTHVGTQIRFCVVASVRRHIHTGRHAHMHTCMSACKLKHRQAYVHVCIHTYVQ